MWLLISWTVITWGSIESYRDAAPPSDASDAGINAATGASSDFTMLAILAAIAIAFVVYLRRRLGSEHTLPARSALRRAAISAGAIFAAVTVSRVISRGIDATFLGQSGPSELTTADDWFQAAFSLIAGAAEEPFYSALPILLVALACARWRIGHWLVIVAIVISAASRGLMHLYQGVPWALDGVFWGAVAVYTYYRYRSLTGLIIGHTLFNAINLGVNLDLPVLKWAAITGAVLATAAMFFLAPTTLCYRHTDRSPSEPAERHHEPATGTPPPVEAVATR